MKQKQNKNCLQFKSKYNSMKTVINSLEQISAKCELFFRQFGVKIDGQNRLSDYKKLLSGFKSELGSEYVRRPKADPNLQTISADPSDNEWSDGPNSPDIGSNASDEPSVNGNAVQTGRESSIEVLNSRITEIQVKDKTYGKNIRHYGCPVTGCDFTSLSKSNVALHLAKHTSERDYPCDWPKCEKSFAYRNSLLSHIESYHLRKERFRCCVDTCCQPFPTRVLLQCHMNSTHFEITEHNCVWTDCQLNAITRDVTCLWPKCGKQFPNKELLDIHTEDIHMKNQIHFKQNDESIDNSKPEVWLKCDHKGCDFQTTNAQDIKDHKSKHKTRYVPINRRKDPSKEPDFNKYTGKQLSRRRRTKNFPCSWPACEARFDSQFAVATHMRKHTGEKPFECDWDGCGKRFRFKNALKLHKESIHLKLKQFKCDECDEAFLLQTTLIVHKSKHTGVKRLQCDWPGCEWRTNFAQTLEIHRKRRHEGQKVYIKKYKSELQSSDPHSPYDAKGNLKPYQCQWPGCERRFRLECNLEPHIKWHHRTENDGNAVKKKPFRPKRIRFPKTPKQRKENLIIHPKQWQCAYPGCQSSYTSKNMLQQHINKHTGEKPYQCQHCPQAFAYQTNLKAHINTNHSEPLVDRPFKCSIDGCRRSFDKSRALMAHQRIAHHMKVKNKDIQCSTPRNSTSSQSWSSPQQDIPEPYIQQRAVIPLNRIKAFNSWQNPTPTPIYYTFTTTNQRERQVPTPTPFQTTHTTAKKLLTNALKRPKSPRVAQNYAQPVDSEAIARELPFPCTQRGCWRRFKTVKALDCHIKKFHPN